MPRVVLEGVTKVFPVHNREPVVALSGLSLSVEHNECLAILGPSGSGKTTALRLIAGLETLSSGGISIDGRLVHDLAPKQRDVAMVFQGPSLYPHMSVEENLAFGLRVRGHRRAEIQQRVDEVAQLLGLTELLPSRPMHLSGGQKQRVALGRALVRRASVLLLDEPLANVDPTLRAQMRQEISSLRRKLGTTMIYVTHDHLEALMLGDRVAVLRDGALQQVDEPQALYQHPANLFVAGFVGFPPMNLVAGTLVTVGKALSFQPTAAQGISNSNSTLELPPATADKLRARQKVVLGLRPEQIAMGGDQATALGGVIRARVTSVQTAGPDTYVQAQWHGASILVRAASTLELVRDQDYQFVIDLARACFFDGSSSKAIV